MRPAVDHVAPPTASKLGSGEMFDRIAPRYDAINRVLSLGFDLGWRRQAASRLALGRHARVLDVATGTGDLAIAIAALYPTATIVGLDRSAKMLAVARTKLARAGLDARVSLVEGDAQHLPQASCSMDAATIAFGIRNVPDRSAALRELARVVRPGGRIVVLELGEPQRGLLGMLARVHTRHVVPRLGGMLGGTREYRYLQASVEAFPTPTQFAAFMRTNNLTVIEVVPLMFGACVLFVATPTESL